MLALLTAVLYMKSFERTTVMAEMKGLGLLQVHAQHIAFQATWTISP